MMKVEIRNETEADKRLVEEVTREAFWNLYVPGCNEHYLAHVMRAHEDFVPELNFVAVTDGVVIGSIMYARSQLRNERGESLNTLTFGPVSVHPRFQRKGVGAALIARSIETATNQGQGAIAIYGAPRNYCRFGFVSSKKYAVMSPEGRYPYGLLLLELRPSFIKEGPWKFHESPVYQFDETAAEAFDRTFPAKEKCVCYTQEEFAIACSAFLDP